MPPSSVIVRCFVVVFLVIQVGIPAIQLFAPRPSRWGWQMYSGHRMPVSLEVVFADGHKEAVNPGKLLGYRRTEIDLTPQLVAQLCRAHIGATLIRGTSVLGKQQEVICSH